MPRGHSLRARLLIVELRQCEVDQAVLNRCQRAWQDGRLASAMGGYLAWIACRYEELQGLLAKRVQRLRGRAYGTVSAVHARLPVTMAKLKRPVGKSGCNIGAVNSAEQAQLETNGRKSTRRSSSGPTLLSTSQRSALRFLSFLQVALANGPTPSANILMRSSRRLPRKWRPSARCRTCSGSNPISRSHVASAATGSLASTISPSWRAPPMAVLPSAITK